MRRKPRFPWALILAVLLPLAGCSETAPPAETGGSAQAKADSAQTASDGHSPGDSASVSSAPPTAAKQGDSASKATPPRKPRVEIQTDLGRIVLELEPEKAPLTVDNFLRYVQQGYYDGTVFHQVFPGYVVLGGGYTPELKEKPSGVPVRNEADNGLRNLRGTVALARDPRVIDSGCCQFFINLADNPQLDHQGQEPEKYGYCVFGRVIEGMDVVDRIAQVPTKQQQVQRPAPDAQQVNQVNMVTETLPGVPVKPVLIRRMRVLK